MSQELENSPLERKFKFQYGIRTDVGRKREENQDSHGHAHTSNASVFIVADGMGGAKGGATASALAVDSVLRSVFVDNGTVTEESLRQALMKADALIHSESQTAEEFSGMGTTAVVLSFVDNRLIVAHVGDSRAYYLRNGKLNRLTRDHTLVQELVDSGAIQQAEAHNHPIAHMLTRSLGPTGSVEVEVNTLNVKVHPSDIYLLCCDGLYNLVSDSEIESILASNDPENAAEKLVDLALERGGTDNITVEVVKTCSVADEKISFDIPEPGKLRIVLAREAPAVRSKLDLNGSSSDLSLKEEKKEPSSKKKKKKKKNAVNDVIFKQEGETEEEEEEVTEEEKVKVDPKDPAAQEVKQEELRQLEEMRKLKLTALTVILVAFGVLSFLFLVRPEGRRVFKPIAQVPPPTAITLVAAKTTVTTVPSTLVPSATPKEFEIPEISTANTIPQVVVTPVVTPTTPAVNTHVEDLLNGWPSESVEVPVVPAEEKVVRTPLLTLSESEKSLLDSVLSFSLPAAPKLKHDYLSDSAVVPIDWTKEKIPAVTPTPGPKLLSVKEKEELTAQKAELRNAIRELDIKLSLLDSTSDRELSERIFEVKKRSGELDQLLNKVEEASRILNNEARDWQARRDIIAKGDAARLASELKALDPQVRQIANKLNSLQDEYQEILAQWNTDKSNTELLSKTVAISRDMKVEKTRLEVAIREAVSKGQRLNRMESQENELQHDAIARLIRRYQRQLVFLGGVQPNFSNRNSEKLGQLQQERLDIENRYKELNAVFSEKQEKEYLADVISSTDN